ncbi:MAG: hypothetical protein IPJ65_27030 [Archangiaceae bacterium]|nr:hypothetical protein [Archangiaceae bacterium]
MAPWGSSRQTFAPGATVNERARPSPTATWCASTRLPPLPPGSRSPPWLASRGRSTTPPSFSTETVKSELLSSSRPSLTSASATEVTTSPAATSWPRVSLFRITSAPPTASSTVLDSACRASAPESCPNETVKWAERASSHARTRASAWVCAQRAAARPEKAWGTRDSSSSHSAISYFIELAVGRARPRFHGSTISPATSTHSTSPKASRYGW